MNTTINESLDVRYLTNGKMKVYTVLNTGADPVEFNIYKTLKEVPEAIRHYAEHAILQHCEPDFARSMRVQRLFYPDHPSGCAMKGYANEPCIAEMCRFHAYSGEDGQGQCPRIGTPYEYKPHSATKFS